MWVQISDQMNQIQTSLPIVWEEFDYLMFVCVAPGGGSGSEE